MTYSYTGITFPTASVWIALTLTSFIQAIYVSRDAVPPSLFLVLSPLLLLFVVGWWLRHDGRKRGVKWILDMGLFLYIAWPLVMLYYLFKTRGMRALMLIGAFVGVYLGASVLGVIVSVLLLP